MMAVDDLTLELESGGYAFGERAVVRIVGVGPQTHLWIGLANKNGSCLGVLYGKDLDKLLSAIAIRRGHSSRPGRDPALGRTAEPKKSFRPDGRRRG